MALEIDENGTITMYQGDTGPFWVYGPAFNPEKQYRVYFAIYNNKRQPIGEEIETQAINVEEIKMKINVALSNLLTVPLNKEYEIYYYGIKINEIGTADADTLHVNGGDYGELTEIVVYPRKVSGFLGGQA